MIIRFLDGSSVTITDWNDIKSVVDAIEKKNTWVEVFYPNKYINLNTVTYVEEEEE